MTEKTAFAGIDIGATNIKFGLVDGTGEVLFKQRRPTMVEKGVEPLMHLVTNIGESLLYNAAEEGYDVRHLGIGTPGAVDVSSGKVTGNCPNIPGWEGMEIGRILRERLNLPIYVDNDANTMALAEARFGAAAGHKSVVCVTLGTGVGGGVIIDGKIWRGSNGAAGELGHLSIDFEGPECQCGSSGCIEAYCSSRAMIERTRQQLAGGLTPVFKDVLEDDLENLTIRKLFVAARKGDEVAQATIADTARYLGIGLAGIVNLFNPESVVIGGGIADGGFSFIEAVKAEIKKRAFGAAVVNLRVTSATLGNDAGFIGASILGEN